MAAITEETIEDRPILTPERFLAEFAAQYGDPADSGLLFDPCPYPRPEGFDGLKVPWKKANYVNPLFGETGFTPWLRKAIAERELGNTSILTLPVWSWQALMLEHVSEIQVRRDWMWKTPSGREMKPSQPLIAWVLRDDGQCALERNVRVTVHPKRVA